VVGGVDLLFQLDTLGGGVVHTFLHEATVVVLRVIGRRWRWIFFLLRGAGRNRRERERDIYDRDCQG
jgi:hypothetical protein